MYNIADVFQDTRHPTLWSKQLYMVPHVPVCISMRICVWHLAPTELRNANGGVAGGRGCQSNDTKKPTHVTFCLFRVFFSVQMFSSHLTGRFSQRCPLNGNQFRDAGYLVPSVMGEIATDDTVSKMTSWVIKVHEWAADCASFHFGCQFILCITFSSSTFGVSFCCECRVCACVLSAVPVSFPDLLVLLLFWETDIRASRSYS